MEDSTDYACKTAFVTGACDGIINYLMSRPA